MKQKNISSIYYDKTRKKYVVSYSIKNNETGEKKRTRRSFNTKEEAEDFLKELEYKKGDKIFIENNGIPLCELMKFIVERKLKTNHVGAHQYGKTLKIIDRIEKAGIGKKDISEITSEEIQDYFNSLTNYSNHYMEKFTEQFSKAFSYAHNKGYIKINPMADTYRPKSAKPDKILRALELEEQETLTDYLKSKTIEEEPYKNAFLIQLYAGLRIGEVLALQYKDIDLDKRLIHINKTIARDENERIILKDTTKTSAGIREVPIQDIILDELKEQKEISKKHFDNQLFLSNNRSYADPKNVNKILKRIMFNICKTTDITTHCLRHTYGTRCIESGIAPVVVQRLMGHKDIAVTLNTYTSVLNRFKEEEIEKLNNYYQNKNLSKKNNSKEER